MLGQELDWPTLPDVEEAARTLHGVALNTPCLPARSLSGSTGADVVLKFENHQRTGSYKMRGAYCKLTSLTKGERVRGVVAASAGNHAQGVAFAASQLGIDCTIVMPNTTPYCKVRDTQAYGVNVYLLGSDIADAFVEAQRISIAERRTLIPPFDDASIVAGAGTVGLEMLYAFSDLQVLLVQVGGGGLIAGIALVAKTLNPSIRVVAVQTELYPGLYNLNHGLTAPIGGATLAEGVAVSKLGDLNSAMTALVDDVILVDEETLEHAVYVLLEDEKTVVEGAGAVGVAGLLQHRKHFAGSRVGIVLSGGNIDTGLLAHVISRERLRARRVISLRSEMLDVPGGLARVACIVAQHGANVLEVSHRRMFPKVLAKCMQLDLTIEVHKPSDVVTIVQRLNEDGFSTTIPTQEST